MYARPTPLYPKVTKLETELMESRGQVGSLEAVVTALEGEMSTMEAAMAKNSGSKLSADQR